jgi:hypothetical protein
MSAVPDPHPTGERPYAQPCHGDKIVDGGLDTVCVSLSTVLNSAGTGVMHVSPERLADCFAVADADLLNLDRIEVETVTHDLPVGMPMVGDVQFGDGTALPGTRTIMHHVDDTDKLRTGNWVNVDKSKPIGGEMTLSVADDRLSDDRVANTTATLNRWHHFSPHTADYQTTPASEFSKGIKLAEKGDNKAVLIPLDHPASVMAQFVATRVLTDPEFHEGAYADGQREERVLTGPDGKPARHMKMAEGDYKRTYAEAHAMLGRKTPLVQKDGLLFNVTGVGSNMGGTPVTLGVRLHRTPSAPLIAETVEAHGIGPDMVVRENHVLAMNRDGDDGDDGGGGGFVLAPNGPKQEVDAIFGGDGEFDGDDVETTTVTDMLMPDIVY